MSRTKPTPIEVAREQWSENRGWLRELTNRNEDALDDEDIAELAALHHSLATVMRGVQKRDATRGGEAGNEPVTH